ncbi:hypothetical protein D5086_033103 [Populus alba]
MDCVNTLTTGMADVDGTSSNHTFPPGTSDMAKITTRKKKKDCVKKKKHRKAQNRDGRTYQKSEVETSLNTIYDLAIITVLYGEEVLKSQCQEMVDKEGCGMGENGIIPSRFCNRHLFLPYLLRSCFSGILELQGVGPKDM